ncbi:MAG: hypothetical protein K5873_11435 [Treponema sp.]|nr:hypothetical protein [Treponema sp.]
MADIEKSIYGRKVFFIGANVSFETLFIERLRLMEYEVYIIDDYRKAKAILRKNPDAIAFCLIENQLNYKGWHNFIKSFTEENVFAPLDIGVIANEMPDEKLKNFTAGIELTAGIVKIQRDTEAMLHEIVKAMDANNAKGMRKYVRASCVNESQADLLWLKNNRMFKLKIIDISAVGLAAKLSAGQANSIGINQILTNVSVNLKSETIPVDIKVTAMKAAGDFLLVVIMFETSTLPDSINRIRAYIADNLQNSLRASFRSYELDRTDYEKLY